MVKPVIPRQTWLCLTGVLTFSACLFIGPCESKIVACYYPNWSQYRPAPATYTVSNIDPWACNIFIFAFAKLVGNSIVAYEANDDQSPWMYRQFTSLKDQNPSALTLLALGGYSHGTGDFRPMSASPSRRAEFISNAITTLRYWRFDGLDLDWEYPDAVDKDNFSILVKEIREGFEREAASSNRKRLLLTAAVPAGIERIRSGYDVATLARYLDLFNVMTYDYHGNWENMTAPATPLYAAPGDNLNVVDTMNYYVEQGAPKSKLNVGISLYARGFTKARPDDTAISSPTIGGSTPGKYTREPGFMSHYEVCELLRNGCKEETDPVGRVKYCNLGDQWVTYEDETTINEKVDYIISNDYAGAMVWSLDHDDLDGSFCQKGRNVLMRVISGRLLSAPDTYSESNTTTSTTTAPTTTASTTTASTITTSTTIASTTTASTTTAPITTRTAPTSAATAASIQQTTTAASTQTSTSSGNSQQEFKCQVDEGKFPHPSDCRSYYVCYRKFTFHFVCPSGTVYNAGAGRCVSDQTYPCQV